MKVETLKINLEKGLYARVATIFCQKAFSYASHIWLEKDGRKVNGKSLLGVLSLGLTSDSDVKVIVEGIDEDLALTEIKTFLSAKN